RPSGERPARARPRSGDPSPSLTGHLLALKRRSFREARHRRRPSPPSDPSRDATTGRCGLALTLDLPLSGLKIAVRARPGLGTDRSLTLPCARAYPAKTSTLFSALINAARQAQ